MFRHTLIASACLWTTSVTANSNPHPPEVAFGLRAAETTSLGLQVLSPELFDSHWLRLGLEIAARTVDTVDAKDNRYGGENFGEAALVFAGDEPLTDSLESQAQIIFGAGQLKGQTLDGQDETLMPCFLDVRIGLGLTRPETSGTTSFGISFRQDFLPKPLSIQGTLLKPTEAGIYMRTGYRF